jgi:hypothetical protein
MSSAVLYSSIVTAGAFLIFGAVSEKKPPMCEDVPPIEMFFALITTIGFAVLMTLPIMARIGWALGLEQDDE